MQFSVKRENQYTIHEIGKPIRVRSAIELSNVHDVIFVLQNRCFIVVHVEIIWRREDGHDSRKLSSSSFTIHAVTRGEN